MTLQQNFSTENESFPSFLLLRSNLQVQDFKHVISTSQLSFRVQKKRTDGVLLTSGAAPVTGGGRM
jgi:hypothetical protein